MKNNISIMLTGGGARGAYQAGVLWRMSESVGVMSDRWKIESVSGISAGSINAAYFASCYSDLSRMKNLADLWCGLRSKNVFRTDLLTLSRIGSSFLVDTAFGPLFKKKLAASLVDTEPLGKLLREHLDVDAVDANICSDGLKALAISSYDFNSDASVCFLHAAGEVASWNLPYRRSEFAKVEVDQIMASCAIPLIFPPVLYQGRYFADGVIRNTAPLSPSIHLGADKIVVIDVQREKIPGSMAYPRGKIPSIATTLGTVLNALFFDNFETDIERLEYLNRSVEGNDSSPFKKIPYFKVSPSKKIVEIAKETYRSLPRQVRYLLGGLGDSRETLEVASYLLFESEYTTRLVKLGYDDFKSCEDSFKEFLSS